MKVLHLLTHIIFSVNERIKLEQSETALNSLMQEWNVIPNCNFASEFAPHTRKNNMVFKLAVQ